MATEKMTMMKNFDYDALLKWAENHDTTIAEISRSLGFNSSYFTNAKKRNRLPKSSYNFLLMKYSLPDGSFIKKEQEIVKEAVQVEEKTVDADKILHEIEEVHIAVHKLGNIMMQLLEYVKDIRDEVK